MGKQFTDWVASTLSTKTTLAGTEYVEITDGGTAKRTTTQNIANLASGGGSGATSINFNSSAAGSNFQPFSGSAATNYFASTANFSVTSPGLLRVRAAVSVPSTSDGYNGLALSSAGGSRLLFVGLQNDNGGGPVTGVVYDTPLGSTTGVALVGYIAAMVPWAVGELVNVELNLAIGSSTKLFIGGMINGIGVGHGGVSDIDLTGSITAYAVGSTSAVISSAAYTNTLF